MDLTRLFNVQALDFDIWGFHVKANLIMSILILVVVTCCWIWHKWSILRNSQVENSLANEKSIRDFEIEKQNLLLEEVKLKQAELEANRRKPTWCHACDVNMKFFRWTPVPGDEEYVIKQYKCPSCGATDYCRK